MTHNPIRPWRNIERRRSRQIMVGRVPVGGDAPISVQTMTNTDSSDVRATLAQVIAAADAGADIVRVSTPDEAATRALREITRESPVPIVADIHFHYRRAIEAAQAGAACLRINPGNIGDAARVREVVGPDVPVEVDGGIAPDTAPRCRDAGASVFVAGNAIFAAPDPAEAYREIARSVGAL